MANQFPTTLSMRSHVVAPVVIVGLVLLGIAWFDGDARLAHAAFFDESMQRWVGRESVWASEVLHRWGRNVMRLAGLLAIVGWLASFRSNRLARHRRSLGYLALCLALVPLTVGALKQTTNVDCPWDLQGFGGDRPPIAWYQDRPDDLPRAACFPGAHSSSAFALFALYFIGLASHPVWARWSLVGVMAWGGLFSLAQQSRGAHFLSHDLVSALVAWLICLGLYRWMFKRE